MRRLRLIAAREFKTYVATASFWVALALGPILSLGAYGLIAAARHEPAPLQITLSAVDPQLRGDAAGALEAAARVMGRPLRIGEGGDIRVRVEATPKGPVASFDGEALPAAARAVFAAELERRRALALAARAGAPAEALAARLTVLTPPASVDPAGARTAGRFVLVLLLWLTLTGSLGMLLQAVVRERANHALDILMAAARPSEIVFGKLLGVGGVSALVTTAWLGAAAALGAATGNVAGGPLHTALAALAEPRLLLQAACAYGLAYVMYGAVTVALGARAADIASAQNLSRPMFGVLLLAFFVALASTLGAARGLAWTIWIPPLTPFIWMLTPPELLSTPERLAAPLLMGGGALLAGWIAKASLGGGRSGARHAAQRRRAEP